MYAKRLAMVLTLFSLAGLLLACAERKPEARAVVRVAEIAEVGDTVHLYYAKSKKAKEEFCPEAVVPVYRMGEGYYLSKTEVGKIRVTKELGERHIEAEVIEGSVMAGDIAMQPNSECLLQIPQPPPAGGRHFRPDM